MSDIFGSEFFAGNRARLRELFTGSAPIVITANGLLQRTGDNPFAFQQDSNFWYLTGIDEPNVLLVLDKDKEYLIVPEHTDAQDIFDGNISAEQLTAQSGITTIVPAKEGWRLLGSRLKRAKHVATLAASPAYIAGMGMYTNPARATLLQTIKEYHGAIEILDLREHLARMRVVKQPIEIATLQTAVDITVAAFRKVQKRTYEYEYQLEADLSHLFRKAGATGHAYSPIVGNGKNALILHYLQNNDPVQSDALTLVDAGAAFNHYNADISRTWSQAKPTSRQRAVIAAVNEVLEYGLEQLKPGPSFYECEQRVREYMGEKLRALGLIKSIDKEAVHSYYPHAPHYLGLDVHDVGDYQQPLEAGMVLTIEPGIYIAEENIGVRIEEDIVITETGYRILSAGLPRVLASPTIK